MLGRCNKSSFGKVYFSRGYVSFRECIVGHKWFSGSGFPRIINSESRKRTWLVMTYLRDHTYTVYLPSMTGDYELYSIVPL